MTKVDRKLNVVLVEDHEDYRRSLDFLLNSTNEFTCVSFPDAPSALSSLEDSRPDVVIMDINLPGPSGIDLTRMIKERWPELQVMVCTVHDDEEKIFGALKAGATGYMLKRAPIAELIDAIKQTWLGGSPMSAGIARKVVMSFQRAHVKATNAGALSPRELEILDLLAEGLRIKEIAERLFVSLNTVRTHIRHIYEKLQVQSRIEALNKVRGGKY